jgi:hypothetical protein
LPIVNANLQPGYGVFVQIPNSAVLPQNITLVGNVLQGTLTTPIAAAYQVVSSQVPQSGLIQTGLGLAPASTDKVFSWLPLAQNYASAKTYNAGTGTWLGGEPSVQVGEAVVLLGHAGSAWSRNFTVQ